MRTVLVCCAVLVGFLVPLCQARKEKLVIDRDDRAVFHIESFGYEPGGKLKMSLTNFELYVRHPDDWKDKTNPDQFKIAFVLQQSTTDAQLREDSTEGCFHDTLKDVVGVQVWPIPARAKWPDTTDFTKDIEDPGYYHLYFSNCEESTQTSFHLSLEEYNVDISGKRNYLSAGESSLPTWYFLLCGAFVAELVVWVNYVRKNRTNIRNIHYLMTCVLLLKIVTLTFESGQFHYIKTTGTAHGWNVAYYIFTFLKSSMLFAVIVLIGTGWSYLKPFLTERDKQIVLAVLVVQMMVNIAMVVISETSPGARSWLTWRDILHLLDMVCCCAILLPIVWSIRHLREAAEADGKAARNVERLKRFRRFYLLVVSYIYFTRIIVYLMEATLPFELTWLGNVINELAALVFYLFTGYLFRPVEHNPFLAQETEDADFKPIAAQMEDL